MSVHKDSPFPSVTMESDWFQWGTGCGWFFCLLSISPACVISAGSVHLFRVVDLCQLIFLICYTLDWFLISYLFLLCTLFLQHLRNNMHPHSSNIPFPFICCVIHHCCYSLFGSSGWLKDLLASFIFWMCWLGTSIRQETLLAYTWPHVVI